MFVEDALLLSLPDVPMEPTDHAYTDEEFYAIYGYIAQVMHYAAYLKREISFLPTYRAEASKVETAALLLTQHIGWSFDVLDACIAILEDANFATAVRWMESLRETGRPIMERLPRACPGRYLRGRAHIREHRRIIARRQQATAAVPALFRRRFL